MTDETALLVALLDRPGDMDRRLVYADWLEDSGQNQLAEWLRLHATLRRALSVKQRRMHEIRLQKLREAHRKDWVEFGGLLLTWNSVLLLVAQRLAETLTWCSLGKQNQLRSPQLLPDRRSNASAIETLWRCRRPSSRSKVVHKLASRRAGELNQFEILMKPPDWHLGGGKLLLFDADAIVPGSSGGVACCGFLDSYLAPPWDTWLGYFDDGAEGHRRAHAHWEAEWIMNRAVAPVPFPSYLVSWVPHEWIAAVDWARTRFARPNFDWAENIDCDFTARLRELGWFANQNARVREAWQRQNKGFAWTPTAQRNLTTSLPEK
jgi:uncharacterized protein (TIGR02996 family)